MTGRTIAHYEILEKLGEGGMGVVYRARDTALHRDVAIKVLPEDLSTDRERMERFRREAQLLAQLNHPNIAAIHDLAESDGQCALVMELAEGRTLADRMAEGPIPAEDAVLLAKQIAEALEAAHERGIIHRDLKPANIKVDADGNVKVLDFGLAKAFAVDGSSAALETDDSPTITVLATQGGVILGTAPYMSPEQARGRAVDRRSDIWAFGVVFHEMLTGRQLFAGETVSDTLAGVLRAEIDFEALPSATPRCVRHLLKRCLERDRRKRLQAVGEARIALEQYLADPTPDPPERSAPSRSRFLPWALAGLFAIAFAVAAWLPRAETDLPGSPLVTLDVDLGSDVELWGGRGANAIVSPDGGQLVYVTQDRRIYVRPMDGEGSTLLDDEGMSPFFSPYGEWVAFFSRGKLKKIPVSGGAATTLCDAPAGRGGTWGDDGTIVAALNLRGPLWQIPEQGGEPREVSNCSLSTEVCSHRWPQFLPGSATVLFTAQGGLDSLVLKTGERKLIIKDAEYGRFVPSGHVIFVRRGVLFAAPFDKDRLELTAQPVAVIENVLQQRLDSGAQFHCSVSGVCVYQKGSGKVSGSNIVLVFPDGTTQPLSDKPRQYISAVFAPDSRSLVSVIGDGAESHLWLHDLDRGVVSRLTSGPTRNREPAWTPDSRHIVFSSGLRISHIYYVPADGSSEPRLLLKTPVVPFPYSFSPDGKFLAFAEQVGGSAMDIFVVPIENGSNGELVAGEPSVFLSSPDTKVHPTFSRDGRWIAYASNESGSFQVYVRPFPGPGGRWQVSSGAAGYPSWSPDGKRLGFGGWGVGPQTVEFEIQDGSFAPGKPYPWSESKAGEIAARAVQISMAPDWRSYAAIVPVEERKQRTQLTFLFNFFDELKRRVPAEH